MKVVRFLFMLRRANIFEELRNKTQRWGIHLQGADVQRQRMVWGCILSCLKAYLRLLRYRTFLPIHRNNSDIPERLVSGQFTRMTMRIDIDDAYLFDVRYRDVYSIEVSSELREKTIEDDSKDMKIM